MQKILPKRDLNGFLSNLMKSGEIVIPVKGPPSKFKIIKERKDLESIYIEKVTDVPLKKYFFPDNEILVKFEDGEHKENLCKIKKTIVFGLRKCDVNALMVLDRIMKDPNYICRRKNTILIGIHCLNPDSHCFCESMELLEKGWDLFFYERGKDYYISVGSKKGERLVESLRKASKEFRPKIVNKKYLKSKDIGLDYRNEIWKKDADNCLSCAACTVYCPTCNCFDIKDNLEIGLKNGVRERSESSCMLISFSRVAGGRVFRESRLSRFKHFVYHKIDYFKKSHGRYMCVGCGRCLRVCPTKIDWVETINSLKIGK